MQLFFLGLGSLGFFNSSHIRPNPQNRQQSSTGTSAAADKEELEFNFDEEDGDFSMRTPTGRQNRFSNWNNDSSDVSDADELSDGEISKLVIVTQTPSRPKKHDGFDRTGDYTTRTKLSQVCATSLNVCTEMHKICNS